MMLINALKEIKDADHEETEIYENYSQVNKRVYKITPEGKKWLVRSAARQQVVLQFQDGWSLVHGKDPISNVEVVLIPEDAKDIKLTTNILQRSRKEKICGRFYEICFVCSLYCQFKCGLC